jgi:hypothetical protein
MLRSLAAYLILLTAGVAAVAQEHSRPVTTPTPRPTAITRPTPISKPTPIPVPESEGWVTFNSEPGRFSILVPDIPTEKTDVVQSEYGPYTSHFFTVRSTKSLFLIGWVDYDPSFNFNPTLELEANRDNFIKGIKATLTNNQPGRIDGYQTLEFTAETFEMVFKSRVYMVGRRPFLVVARTAKAVDDTANVDRFFASLKFRR